MQYRYYRFSRACFGPGGFGLFVGMGPFGFPFRPPRRQDYIRWLERYKQELEEHKREIEEELAEVERELADLRREGEP
jgi:hypothetical protein